jgi:hypothetical protein
MKKRENKIEVVEQMIPLTTENKIWVSELNNYLII